MALIIAKSIRGALETTVGTPVTPTRIIYGTTAEHVSSIDAIIPDELRGSWEPNYRASAGPESNVLTRSGSLTYDDLIWELSTHVKGVVAGTLSDTTAYTWTYLPNAALVDDTKSATVEFAYGDSIATTPGVRLPGLRGDELSVTWDKPSGDVTFDSSMASAYAGVDITAFSGALSDRTGLIPISALNTTVYVDTTTIGTTVDPNFQKLSWSLTNGYSSLFTLDATNAAKLNARTAPRRWDLTATRYYANNTERALYTTKGVRKIRIKTVSTTLAGAATVFFTATLDCYGVWEELKNAESDGFGMHALKLHQIYDSASGSSFNWTVITKTAALT